MYPLIGVYIVSRIIYLKPNELNVYLIKTKMFEMVGAMNYAILAGDRSVCLTCVASVE